MSRSVLPAGTAIDRAPWSALACAALSGHVSPAAPVAIAAHRMAEGFTDGIRSGSLRLNGAVVWPTGPPGGVAG